MYHIKQVVASTFGKLPKDGLSFGEWLMTFIEELIEGMCKVL